MQHRHSLIDAPMATLRQRLSRIVRPCTAFLLACTVGGIVFAQAAPKAPAAPQAKPAVSVQLTQRKVTKDAQGKEQLIDAATVKPGDVLEYQATYTNTTSKVVTGLVGNLPIPEGLEYLPKSAKPGATLVKAATNDGVFAAEPLVHMVAGKTVPVGYGDYRSLRWTLGQLPANGVTVVSARAKVQVVVPSAPMTSAAAAQAPPVAVRPAASATPR